MFPSVKKVAERTSRTFSRTFSRTLEWQVCEDEGAWEDAQQTWSAARIPNTTPTRLQSFWQRYRVHALCVALIALSSGGWWAWQRGEAGIAQAASEIEAEIIAEAWRGDVLSTYTEAGAPTRSTTLALPTNPGEIVTQIEIRDLGADWAVVDVSIQPKADGPSFRQTRVYHEDAKGWVRVPPRAEHWGPTRHFESQYFIFGYHAVDEEAVKLAAPQLDVLYPALRNMFDREPQVASRLPTLDQKLTITVDPAQTPGIIRKAGAPEPGVVVASPAALLVPSGSAAGDVLLQASALALYDHLVINGFTLYSQDDPWLPGQWYRLHTGLRLWFIWEYELPLAVWREPLVRWVYAEQVNGAPNNAPGRGAQDVPAFARDLCAHQSLWMRTPLEVSIPILCWHSDEGDKGITTWRYHDVIKRLSLNLLLYSASMYSASMDDITLYHDLPLPEPGPSALISATLFEYTATTYGADAVAAMVAAIPAHKEASTLIPSLYGVTVDEFEQGWRAFLNERYTLD